MTTGQYVPNLPRRILIVRLSAIGDAIHSLPLAAAIRRSIPDCRLGWVVEQPASPLIVGNPLLDWVRVLPKGWLKKPSLVRNIVREVRAERFDAAIDVHGLFKSSVIPWLAGIRTRVGFTRGEARELAPILDNRLVEPPGRHVVANSLALLSALGLKAGGRPELVLPPCPGKDRLAIESFLADRKYAGGFCLFGPWTTNLSKCWPPERFAQLAAHLRERTGLPSLALGHGEAERGAVEKAAREEGSGAMRLAPAVSVLGVAELERRASLFVGCDSFPLHLAAGLGRPTLGLFGVSDPERVGPHLPGGRSVYAQLTLTRSSRQRAKLDQTNMLSLGVDKVLTVCREMLDSEKEKS